MPPGTWGTHGFLQVTAEGSRGLLELDSLIVKGMTGPQNNRGQVAVLNYQKPEARELQ